MPNHGTSVSSVSSDVLGSSPRAPTTCVAHPRQRGGHEETHSTVLAGERWARAQQDPRANKTQVSGDAGGGCAFTGQGDSLRHGGSDEAEGEGGWSRNGLGSKREKGEEPGSSRVQGKGEAEAGLTQLENYCQEVSVPAQ